MAYAAVYVVRADIEAELDATTFNSALTDSEKTQEEVYEGCALAADAEVASAVALIQAMGRSAPPVAFLRYCGKIFMCRLLYRRHGLGGERNPYDDSAEDLRKQLNDIANGDLKSGGFGHLSIEDAQPNIFMGDGDATASSSSGGGGGGGGGGGVVESLNGLTGAVTIAPGKNITIALSGNTLTVNVEAGVEENPFTAARYDARLGCWFIDDVDVPGTTESIPLDFEQEVRLNGLIRAGGELQIGLLGMTLGGVKRTSWPSTTVNGEDGAVRLLPGENVAITKDGKDFTISATVSGQPFTPTSRVVSALSATVLPTDYLIWMDSEAAGDVQTLTLPDMEADAMTIVVRHLGSDYPTTIVRGANTYQLAGNGAAVAIDWLKATGEWYWRQAY